MPYPTPPWGSCRIDSTPGGVAENLGFLFGVPLYAFAVWMLLNPEKWAPVLFISTFFFILLRLATTVLGLPYAAWGVELSGEVPHADDDPVCEREMRFIWSDRCLSYRAGVRRSLQ